MQGRIFGIKKSTWLKISGGINLSLLVFFILFSIFFIKNYYLWFFFLCIFTGLHSLIKSFLFKLDSACYFGFLLFLIGVAGFFAYYFNLDFKYFYFLSAVGVASILTFFFTHQKFQFFFGLLMVISSVLAFMYSNEVLNLAIFLAIYLSFLFIFCLFCVILIIKYFKNPNKRG